MFKQLHLAIKMSVCIQKRSAFKNKYYTIWLFTQLRLKCNKQILNNITSTYFLTSEYNGGVKSSYFQQVDAFMIPYTTTIV